MNDSLDLSLILAEHRNPLNVECRSTFATHLVVDEHPAPHTSRYRLSWYLKIRKPAHEFGIGVSGIAKRQKIYLVDRIDVVTDILLDRLRLTHVTEHYFCNVIVVINRRQLG